MSDFLLDTFTGTSGTPILSHVSDSGAAWIVVGDPAASDPANYQLDGSGTIGFIAPAPAGFGNLAVSPSITIPNGDFFTEIDISAAAAPAPSYDATLYWSAFDDSISTGATLNFNLNNDTGLTSYVFSSIFSDTESENSSAGYFSLPINGSVHTLRMEFKDGKTINILYDGVLQATSTLPTTTIIPTIFWWQFAGDNTLRVHRIESGTLAPFVPPPNPYPDLITLEHISKPNFVEMVKETTQPFVDIIQFLGLIPTTYYDIDVAIGVQLDTLGLLIGVPRPGGFSDDYYRIILKVRILNNHWQCNKPSAYELANELFSGLGFSFFIEDHADLSITLGVIGSGVPSGEIITLLTGGYMDVKPVTIRIAGYAYQSGSGPIFAFDIENTSFAGFDVGSWATIA